MKMQQHNSKLSKSKLLIGAVSMVFLFGCVKKRPDQYAQGQGRYLKSISEYDGKEFDLNTGAAISRAAVTTSSKVVVEKSDAKSVAKTADFLEEFPLVSYATRADLMPKEIEFRARANTQGKYKIRYQVTRDNLKILKVAAKEDIPFEERTSGEMLSDGRMAVPLVGYPLSLIHVEKALTSDNEQTHQKIEQSVQSVSEAEYFKIDATNFIKYRFASKAETFPASFFSFDDDSVWNYAETIISATGRLEARRGLWIISGDSDGRYPSKVKFRRFSETEVIVVNALDVVSHAPGKSENELNRSQILKIPVEFLDYRPSEAGREKGLNEESYKEKHYSQRNFVSFNLANTESKTIKGNKKLDEVRIAENYFSFVVETQGSTNERLKVRYSFYKTPGNKDYQSRSAFRDDLKTFGALSRPVPYDQSQSLNNVSLDDDDKLLKIVRHHTRNVVFHLGEGAQEKYIPKLEQAFQLWNDRLAKANVGLRVIFNKEPKQYGDVRYNIIDLYEPTTVAPWSGVSLSVTDELTGEILSTVAQVHISNLRDSTFHFLTNYMLYKLGVEDSFAVGSAAIKSPLIDESGGVILKNSQSPLFGKLSGLGIEGIYYEKLQGGETSDSPGVSSQIASLKQIGVDLNADSRISFVSSKQKKSEDGKENSKFAENGNVISCSTGVMDADFIAKVERFCAKSSKPGVMSLTKYLETLKGVKYEDIKLDKAVIDGCVDQMLEFGDSITTTAVHEIGHSLGLDHNFMGSADKANFYSKESGEAGSSSIMDYFFGSRETLLGPGTYDLAALRYIYDDKVELKDGSFVKLNSEASMRDQGLDKKIRPYMFCNDEDADAYIDPMCQRFDSGTTVLEVTKNYIADIRTLVSQYSNRLYRPRANPNGFTDFAFDRTIPLRRIYDEWRYHLARKVGQNNQYLEKYSVDQYKAVLADMAKDPQTKQAYQDYYEASRLIFNFLFNDMFFLPNRYCIAQTQEGSYRAIELEKIRSMADSRSNEQIESCHSDMAKAVLAQQNLVLVQEKGFDLYSSRNTVDVKNALRRPYDQMGTVGIRINALAILTARGISLNPLSQDRGFLPSVTDEPDLRSEMTSKLMTRALRGVQIEGYQQTFAQFEQESDLMARGFQIFKQGISSIPSKPEVNVARITPYNVVVAEYQEQAETLPAYLQYGTLFLGVRSENYIARSIIDEYKSAKVAASTKPIPAKELEPFVAVVMEMVPPKASQEKANIGSAMGMVEGFYMKQQEIAKTDPAKAQMISQFMEAAFPEVMTLYKNITSGPNFADFAKQLQATAAKKAEEEKANGGKATAETEEIWNGLQKQLQGLLNTSLYGSSSIQDKMFADFNSEAYVKRMGAKFNQRNLVIDRFKQSPEELEAQANLLVRMLTNQ